MKATSRLCSLVLLLAVGACGGSASDSGAADAAGADSASPRALSIDAITAQETPSGVAVAVSVSVDDESLATVALAAASGDQVVLADGDIVIAGQGASRTLTLIPQAVGLATVTVTATNGVGDTATATFELESYFNRTAWTGVKQWDEGALDSGEDLDVGPSGDIWMAGYALPDTRFFSWLRRVDLSGISVWTAYHDITLDSQGHGVVVFPDATSVMASQAKTNSNSNTQFVYLGMFAAAGGVPAEHDLYDVWGGAANADFSAPNDIAGLDDGSVATSIWGRAGANQAIEVRRLGANGDEVFTTEIWSGTVEARAAGVAMTSSATAGALSTEGTRGSDTNTDGWDAWIVYLDASGIEQWSAQFGTTEDDFIGGVVMDDANNVYVCGGAGAALDPSRAGEGMSEVFVAKYDSAGVRQWLTLSGSAGIDSCRDLSLGRDGTVYAVGTWNFVSGAPGTSTGFVAAYGSDGTELWLTEISASVTSRVSAGAVVHSGRDIIVTGQTNEAFPGYTSTNNDAWLARLSEDGVLQ